MTQPSIFTRTIVPVSDPAGLHDAMVMHLREHDAHVNVQDGISTIAIPEYGMTIALENKPAGLEARIGAPSEGALHFMREEFIEQIAKMDETIAEAIRWDDKEAEPVRPVNFHVFKVAGIKAVLPGLRRVSLKGKAAREMAIGGFHARVILPKQLARPPVWPTLAPNGGTSWPQDQDELHARVVTLKSVDAQRDRVEVDIAIHEQGFVSDWALTAEIGSEVGMMGPGGEVGPRTNGPYLFVGDLTAFAAITRNLESVGPDAEGVVICPQNERASVDAYFNHSKFRIVTIDPTTFEGNAVELVKNQIGSTQFRYGWFGGEFADAQAMRQFFRNELNLGKGANLSVAYWRRGQPGEA